MSMRMKLAVGTFAISTLTAAAAYAVPGPQRMLAPSAYGLTEIAPDVFTDDPDRKEEELRLIKDAEMRVKSFYGTLKASPRYIICTTMMCEKTFGGNGYRALAYGSAAIHIPPKAFKTEHLGRILLTHERAHSELFKHWGSYASILWGEKFPAWFNEGLAVVLSDDDRISYNESAENQAWIGDAKSVWSWSGFVHRRGWKTAYGSAASRVAGIRAAVGDEGLRTLVDRAAAGEDFDKVLSEIMPGGAL